MINPIARLGLRQNERVRHVITFPVDIVTSASADALDAVSRASLWNEAATLDMVEVGEQTGELDRMLHKVSDRYETEVDRAIDLTIQAIEVLLIVVLAVVVGFIVFALLSPLLTLMEQLS